MVKQTAQNDSQVSGSSASAKESELESLTAVTNLVKNYISTIEQTKSELTKQKDMLEDALSGNPQYKEACDEAKEYSKIKADVKRQILMDDKLSGLVSKVKDLSQTLKETKEALSEYLVEYAKLSGSNQIEGDDGQTREIVYTARLVKQTSFSK